VAKKYLLPEVTLSVPTLIWFRQAIGLLYNYWLVHNISYQHSYSFDALKIRPAQVNIS
jgi:hypothetical protein